MRDGRLREQAPQLPTGQATIAGLARERQVRLARAAPGAKAWVRQHDAVRHDRQRPSLGVCDGAPAVRVVVVVVAVAAAAAEKHPKTPVPALWDHESRTGRLGKCDACCQLDEAVSVES